MKSAYISYILALLLFGSNGIIASYIALSGVAMGLSWMFLYEAYNRIGVSISSLLYYCGPVIVILLAPIVFKEKLTVHKLVGLFSVFIGIIFVKWQSGKWHP